MTWDLRDLAAEWEEALQYCADCGETIEPDPDGSIGVYVHDRALPDPCDMDEDHTARPENTEKFEALCAELGITPADPDTLRWYADNNSAEFIAEDEFEDYAREMAESIGAIGDTSAWPASCIDWSKAADELRQDYTTITYDGEEYLTR